MAKEILIADSDRSIQEEFQRIFEPTDYRLIFSDNGEDALQQIKFFKPDLIIATTTLGEKNGLQLCSAVKADAEFKQIPFVLLKGMFEEVPENEQKRSRVDRVISKPLKEGEILNLVDRLLEEETASKEALVVGDLDEPEDEGIIELVDVVEEPESRGRIDDFLATPKEELSLEIPSLETWEKEAEERKNKPSEEEILLSLTEKGRQLAESGEAYAEEIDELEEVKKQKELEEEKKVVEEKKGPKIEAEKAGRPEELLDKIDLDEILKKVEGLRPELEKELLLREKARASQVHEMAEESLSLGEEPAERDLNLEEFEATLQKEFKTEELEEDFQFLLKGEPSVSPPAQRAAPERPVQEERFEERLEEVPIEAVREEPGLIEIPIEEEELKELTEEEFPEALLEEEPKEDELKEEELEEEELAGLEERREVKVELPEELGVLASAAEAVAVAQAGPEQEVQV